jgi:hypothetical protein
MGDTHCTHRQEHTRVIAAHTRSLALQQSWGTLSQPCAYLGCAVGQQALVAHPAGHGRGHHDTRVTCSREEGHKQAYNNFLLVPDVNQDLWCWELMPGCFT